MNQAEAKNKYIKWTLQESFLNMKKKNKNRCNLMSKNTKKQYFKNVSKGGIMNNKILRSKINYFLISKKVSGDN